MRKLTGCLGVVILAGCAGDGWACRFEQRAPRDAAAAADVVFVGRVLVGANDRSGRGSGTPGEFRVDRVLKGQMKAGSRVEVWTSSSSCGLSLVAGQRWVVLASGSPLKSDQTSGSALLEAEGQAGLSNSEAALMRELSEAR